MSRVGDYYLIPAAPYSYLGGERFDNIADRDTIIALADEVGVDGRELAELSIATECAGAHEHDTERAIQRGLPRPCTATEWFSLYTLQTLHFAVVAH